MENRTKENADKTATATPENVDGVANELTAIAFRSRHRVDTTNAGHEFKHAHKHEQRMCIWQDNIGMLCTCCYVNFTTQYCAGLI